MSNDPTEENPRTNTGNPSHNPDDPSGYPKTSDEWVDGHVADDVDADDITDDKWIDSKGRPFRPHAGSKTPTDDRCNAVLRRYRERYGERRYCGQLTESTFNDVDHDYCKTHSDRAALSMQAEEALQHGLSARSRDHVYRKLPDWQKLYAYGLYETLLGQSSYEFGVEHEPMEFDFSDAPFTPNLGGQDGPVYMIDVPHATENGDRDVCLFAAAIDGVKIELANAEIIANSDESPPMAKMATDTAQLTSPTEQNPTQTFKTLDALKEHPLNMAYSRVVSDRSDLLQYGGVEVDGETSDDSSVLEGIESLTMVQADTQSDTPVADRGSDIELEMDGATHSSDVDSTDVNLSDPT